MSYSREADMEAPEHIDERLKRLDARLAADYIPPRETWTPADEALYKPIDLLRVPLDEAQAMQFKAIKYAFKHHYTLSPFYSKYCETRDFTPDDLKTSNDLEKIPLIPDITFKQHPSGEDFAHWLASIFTGDMPTLVVDTDDPTLDDIINAANVAGLVVIHSTGTSGRPSVIPRDQKTYLAQQYNYAKTHFALWDDLDVDHTLLMFPKPQKTNMWAGKGPALMWKLANDLTWVLDMEITADSAVRAWTGQDQREGMQQAAAEMMRSLIYKGTKWLERYENSDDTIQIFAPPTLLTALFDALEQQGKSFDFGERGRVRGGGGWKTMANVRISQEDLLKRMEEVLGITQFEDGYSQGEINELFSTCPEGHYYHTAYTCMKPLVLDSNLDPVGYGERGRLACLDALAHSYPGFIMSGDEVKLLEHCPACERPGPVLDHTIDRLESEEMRGCATTIMGVLDQSLQQAKK
jgi:Acyl-protein synthetase, LuxE